MADYPAELIRKRYLFDGTPATIRPIRAEDADIEQDFVRGLSRETRYGRFMATLRELSPPKLRYLTEIDYERHIALIATIDHDGVEEEIAVARYVVGPDGHTCEFAIVVGDAWQGSGVAGMLMLQLIEVAASRGLKTMEGFVLATNHKMLKFCRQLGFRMEPLPDDFETVRVVRSLDETV
ncbi:GNAT family N-acetyltransferase [Azoarcus taiwanensis]|uniref:GNAT family N-acetyltransferase n=1 Tax=Azoarcus taiwanensis TaxID=666964 RepID=A0A972J945_9RHOO|nr:GNAT family N-acetyltransferase [Azoarcus taiwanensis]NMG01583.1 GNAT family N-acetyltransferase [Azoarcus taiwanensis]